MSSSRSKTKTAKNASQPRSTDVLSFKDGRWGPTQGTSDGIPPISFHLISWNVDYSSDAVRPRFEAAIDHIRTIVLPSTDEQPLVPCILLLQEVDEDALESLWNHSWVQKNFLVVGDKDSSWPSESTYGNVTLVSKFIPITNASTLVFANSGMGRFASIVDVAYGKNRNLRIANVHLESPPAGEKKMKAEQTKRPAQLEAVTQRLKEKELLGGIVCGDMNAFEPHDQELPSSLSLHDAYTGTEQDQQTWGYFQRFGRFPESRPDRMYYYGSSESKDGFRISSPTMIGQGLKVKAKVDEDDDEEEELWVSDHHGLHAVVTVNFEEKVR
jgi:tyrosyl-DNA phosphodiesterase 2